MVSLETYKKKRRFDETPEPKETSEPTGRRFVVQKHAASHLHYDLRLETGGVMVSWAVPKGPSLNPQEKRLAMMTEDHPVDYRNFEGEIPAGNYGAGKVIVWDEGTYEPKTGSVRKAIASGKLTFKLFGHKLRGEFTLIKKKNAEENAWLLVKKHDKYASSKPVADASTSVLSDRPVEKVPNCAPFAAELWREIVSKNPGKLKTPVKPMLASLVEEPFDGDEWIFELKWDGYRAIAEVNHQEVELYSRNGNSFNDKYPSVVRALSELDTQAVFDGEIIAPNEDGIPEFARLQNYRVNSDQELQFQIFDLLAFQGKNVTDVPLTDRKKLLRGLLPSEGIVRYSDHIVAEGMALFELAKDRGLEGVIAKKASSRYRQDKRSDSWLKIKVQHRQEAVIGGYTEPRGSRKFFGALVLGVYEEDRLRYIGHTGTGMSENQRKVLYQKLKAIEQSNSPFEQPPKPNAPVHWVRPEMLCEVSFTEWTRGGHMRHPKLIAVREDKPASQITREEPVPNPKKQQEKDYRFTLTNPDKIFFPELGITKRELFEYYQKIYQKIAPFVEGRPQTLLRHPNGIQRKPFFQKDVSGQLPDWVPTHARYSESNQKRIHYYVVDGIESFLYLVQLGCIEINPWLSKSDSPESPTYCVIDLDPLEVTFADVVVVALEVHSYLDERKIPNFVKTSGKKGLHIYIPLLAGHSYDHSKQFAELIAVQINDRLPKITSVERSPSKRKGKVYLDYLQNRLSQTIASPYSVRPTPEATVSTPLDWSEVTDELTPSRFTIRNLADRIKQTDPWEGIEESGISISDVLDRME